MIRNAFTGEPKPETLAQQQADFSAEGAPLPGNVGQAAPDAAQDGAAGAPPSARAATAHTGQASAR